MKSVIERHMEFVAFHATARTFEQSGVSGADHFEMAVAHSDN